MNKELSKLYQERLKRYTTAMKNEKPDKIPIRPFVAEFVAKYAGYNNQEVSLDYELIFSATRLCAKDFDWDATTGNLIYNWAGVIKTIGWNCFAFPGIELEKNSAVQYIEPPEEKAFMKENEYDQLIDDPTAFLFNVWLPRFTDHIVPPGGRVSFEHNMALLNGGMSMMAYNNANAKQGELLRCESGTVSAISGLLKAPLDIIGDKLRGYLGLSKDLLEQPKKVLKACEALMPHLLYFALAGADADKNVPITIWMHRGCVPFVAPEHFNNIYWPTLKPIVEEIWSKGHQVLFYAEGNWDRHLASFSELPEKSIIYHMDKGDIFKAHKILGEKFCLSGGIPNDLLNMGSEDDVKAYCKKVIDGVASEGGYILDASAIIQDDAKVENIRAMTDFTREYGLYHQSAYINTKSEKPEEIPPNLSIINKAGQKRKPGVCLPWEEKKKQFTVIRGDQDLVQKVWEKNDIFGYFFIWQSFMW
jgi:hypothetical protein